MDVASILIGLLVGVIVGALVGAFALHSYQNSQGRNRRAQAEDEAKAIITEARLQSQILIKDAEEEARKITDESTDSALRRRRELDKEDERLVKRREDLDQRLEKLEQREKEVAKRQSRLDKQEKALAKLQEEREIELQRIANMTVEEAKAELVKLAETEARNDMARVIRQPRPRGDRHGCAAPGIRKHQRNRCQCGQPAQR